MITQDKSHGTFHRRNLDEVVQYEEQQWEIATSINGLEFFELMTAAFMASSIPQPHGMGYELYQRFRPAMLEVCLGDLGAQQPLLKEEYRVVPDKVSLAMVQVYYTSIKRYCGYGSGSEELRKFNVRQRERVFTQACAGIPGPRNSICRYVMLVSKGEEW